MSNNTIEVIFTTICNSFYEYTIAYGFFSLLSMCVCVCVKFIFVYKVCVSFIFILNKALRQVSKMEYSLSRCNNA